ncbi:protein mitoshell [Anopheles stephensi]|uniref:protein mitoshell n=1 Tax=Anopheles stephensi TaxID=30069 RepID=UPI001658A095|nr:protein mitoshell [Anopheles stephensi]
MNPNFATDKRSRSSNRTEQQCPVQMFSVPPPAIPPPNTVPLLMIRSPMPPVWIYTGPPSYDQMQFNFSCSSGNSFLSNHHHTAATSAAGPSTSSVVSSSYEFRMSSIIQNNPFIMAAAGSEQETAVSSISSMKKSPPTTACLLEQFPELVRTALEGCKKAEQLAQNHQKRPCFKKIDSLCARLKQDLVKVDNVMSNINSQGLAWAVKDFIFVFTRIMNAWLIIKGYVPNKPEGMLTIQRELCPNFLDAFGRWHEATHELIHSLIQSFTNLNKLAKQQRSGGNIFAKPEEQPSGSGEGAAASGTTGEQQPQQQPPSAHDLLLGEIGETEPLNSLGEGSYIKAGVYHFNPPPGFEEKTPTEQQRAQASAEGSPVAAVAPTSPKHATITHSDDSSNTTASPKTERQPVETFFRKTWTDCIKWVVDEVRAIEEGQYFYCINFAKNYFPGFHLIASDMIDLRQVYRKHHAGQYTTMAEVIDDLRQIVDTCKLYVEVSTEFEIWTPSEPVPDSSTAIQRQEWENFTKIQNFIAKMECLLALICAKGRSAMTDRGTDGRSLVCGTDNGQRAA